MKGIKCTIKRKLPPLYWISVGLGGISRCLGRRSLRVVIRSEKRCRNLYASLTEVLVYDSD